MQFRCETQHKFTTIVFRRSERRQRCSIALVNLKPLFNNLTKFTVNLDFVHAMNTA